MKLGDIEKKNEEKRKKTKQKNSDVRLEDFDHVKDSVAKLRTESSVKRIELSKILEHPQNKKLFSMDTDDVERLARNIMERGFVGCILVYSNRQERGTYTIFSGHKRYHAVKYLWEMYGQEKISLENKKKEEKITQNEKIRLEELENIHNTIPVYVQNLAPDMTDKDIVKDLITSNTYNRVLKRWDYGNLIAYLYAEHTSEKKIKGRFIDNCAEIVGLHANTIYRYLAVNRLGKKLMHLAYDNETFPYTGLANSEMIRKNELLKEELYRRLIVARSFARGNLEEFTAYLTITDDYFNCNERIPMYESECEIQKSQIEKIVYELNDPNFEQISDVSSLPKNKFTEVLKDILSKNNGIQQDVCREMLMMSGYSDIMENILTPDSADTTSQQEKTPAIDTPAVELKTHAPFSPKSLRRTFLKMQKQAEQIVDSGIRQKSKKDAENIADLKQIIDALETSITEIKKLLPKEE